MKSRKEKPVLISVVGPTAVGKTALAIRLAQHYQTEIISCDSRQFFRELEIGTAKPNAEELATVPHHFINNLSIHDYYSVGRFEEEAIQLLEEKFNHQAVMIMVGGSGLYCQAVWQGMDEMPPVDLEEREALNQLFASEGIKPLQVELSVADPVYYEVVDKSNHTRLIRALEVTRSTGKTFSSFRKGSNQIERPFEMINIGLEMAMENLYDRIDRRMDLMITQGLFEEAGLFFDYRALNALRTVGYQEIYGYMQGDYDQEEAVRLLKRNSRRYAKRQMTWFKKNERIHWFSLDKETTHFDRIQAFLDQKLSGN